MNRYPYVHVEVASDEAELMMDRLWSEGAQGIEERDSTTLAPGPSASEATAGASTDRVLLVASFAETADAARTAAEVGGAVRFVEGDDWREAWREHFQVTPIGQRLLLRPSWRPVPEGHGRTVLSIDPGGAFGTGLHESTRLVLGVIDREVCGGERVLDVGCGSGILAIAALLLGADTAMCIDVDEASVDTTRENAEINRVDTRLQAATTDIAAVPSRYDLVLANIQAHVLIPMAPRLMERVAPGGALILSGILAEQATEVAAAYAPLTPCFVSDGSWRAIVLRVST